MSVETTRPSALRSALSKLADVLETDPARETWDVEHAFLEIASIFQSSDNGSSSGTLLQLVSVAIRDAVESRRRHSERDDEQAFAELRALLASSLSLNDKTASLSDDTKVVVWTESQLLEFYADAPPDSASSASGTPTRRATGHHSEWARVDKNEAPWLRNMRDAVRFVGGTASDSAADYAAQVWCPFPRSSTLHETPATPTTRARSGPLRDF